MTGLKRRRLDVGDLVGTTPVPSATALQRRVADWLQHVRDSGAPGLWDVRVGRSELDSLDVVMNTIVQAGARALAFRPVVGAVVADDPGPIDISIPTGSIATGAIELQLVARELRHAGADVTVNGSAGRSEAMRERAWIVRDAWRRERRARNVREGHLPAVLFTAQLPGHIGDVEAVARSLRDSEGLDVGFIVGDGRAGAAAIDAGFAVVDSHDRAPAVADALAGVVRARWRVARSRAGRSGHGDDDLLWAVVARALEAELPAALLVAATTDIAVNDPRVQAVVTPNPVTWVGRTVARCAQSAGVPVIALEHGSVFPDDPRWRDLPVDSVCAWGDSSRRAFLSSGVPADLVAVTGAPRFDSAARSAVRAPRSVQSPALPARHVDVLVATSGAGDHVGLDEHLRFIAILAEAVASTSTANWTIKLHPKDPVDLYRGLRGANVRIVPGDLGRRASIFDHLADADVLVTVASTTAVDAMRAGVPVVSVWLPVDHGPPEFVARTASCIVDTAPALVEAVAAAGEGQLTGADPRYLADHFAHEGSATSEVVAEVVGLIRDPDAGCGQSTPITATTAITTAKPGARHVLHILNGARGGAALTTVALIDGLAAHDIRSSIACHDDGTAAERQVLTDAVDGRITFLPLYWWNRKTRSPWWRRPLGEARQFVRTGAGRISARRIEAFLAGSGVDLVHSGTLLNPEGVHVSEHLHVPHVWHVRELVGAGHPYSFPRQRRFFARRVVPHCTMMIANSHATADALAPYVPRAKLVTVSNGIDADGFVQAAPRRPDSADPAPIVVGMVANLTSRWKCHELFLRAAALVDPGLPVRFSVFGVVPPTGDTYADALRSLAADSGVASRLDWVGFEVDPVRIMESIDILVHPTGEESFGRIVVEAMLAGRPVVGIRGGGVGEIVVDGQTGLLVDAGDAPGMAHAIARFVLYPDERIAMGLAGRERAIGHYSLESMVAGVMAAYVRASSATPVP